MEFEKSPLPENVPRGVSNLRHFGSEPKHYQLSYSGSPLHFETSICDLDFDSRSQEHKEAKTSVPIISKIIAGFGWNFVRLVCLMDLVLTLSSPSNIQWRESN